MIRLKEFLTSVWILISGVIVISICFGIVIFLIYKGIPFISKEFLFDSPKGIPFGTEGGIFPAAVGSVVIGILSGLIGGIIAIFTAIYLVFYCKKNYIKKTIENLLKCLAGIPSIVIGMFGYSFFVFRFELGRSLISVCLTLVIMTVPFICIRIKKAFEECSKDQFIISRSLGVSKSYSVMNLIIPSSKKYIMTSIGLGIVFAMGATAPIMFTGAVIIAKIPSKFSDPVMSLSYHLYMLVNEGIFDMAYATALILIVIVFIINIICHIASDIKFK